MAKLIRFAHLSGGTLGRLYSDRDDMIGVDDFVCYILERPWINNQVNVSCIPDAVYEVKPDEEGKYTGHPEIQAVPGRTEIIIHPANEVHEIIGCLAPGSSFAINAAGEPTVISSRAAYEKVLEKLGTTFDLTISSYTAEIPNAPRKEVEEDTEEEPS